MGTKHTTNSDGSKLVAPVITAVGDVIGISKTGFRFDGKDEQLADDIAYKVVPNADARQVIEGHLVRHKEGKLGVMVDEIAIDGHDEPFRFQGSDYTKLAALFYVELAAGSTDLSDMQTWTIEKRPDLPPPVTGPKRGEEASNG